MENLPLGFLSLGNESFSNLLGTRAPPQLLDKIVEKIFLRIPPDDHERLLCTALICKRWAHLIAGSSFRRRYRERHQTPLLLGFLGNLISTSGYASFVPTGSFRPVCPDLHDYRVHDARHGRVLLSRAARRGDVFQRLEATFIVWDPVMSEQWSLPPLLRDQPVRNWNAAVLCANASTDVPVPCDHLDCHPSHFLVVFVGIDGKDMFASVYSSGSATWSEATSMMLPRDHLDEAVLPALAGNALYFVFQRGIVMLRYNLSTRAMSMIPLPYSPYLRHIMPMAMEDGGLGLVEVDTQYNLMLWSMENGPDGNFGRWVLSRYIELSTLPPAHAHVLFLVAVADAVGVIYVYTVDGVYTFDLNSG